MARMVRKQFYIDAATERALAERAEALGVQQAELVRAALDGFLNGEPSGERRSSAWEGFRKLTTARAAASTGSAPRTWTREDAHER